MQRHNAGARRPSDRRANTKVGGSGAAARAKLPVEIASVGCLSRRGTNGEFVGSSKATMPESPVDMGRRWIPPAQSAFERVRPEAAAAVLFLFGITKVACGVVLVWASTAVQTRAEFFDEPDSNATKLRWCVCDELMDPLGRRGKVGALLSDSMCRECFAGADLSALRWRFVVGLSFVPFSVMFCSLPLALLVLLRLPLLKRWWPCRRPTLAGAQLLTRRLSFYSTIADSIVCFVMLFLGVDWTVFKSICVLGHTFDDEHRVEVPFGNALYFGVCAYSAQEQRVAVAVSIAASVNVLVLCSLSKLSSALLNLSSFRANDIPAQRASGDGEDGERVCDDDEATSERSEKGDGEVDLQSIRFHIDEASAQNLPLGPPQTVAPQTSAAPCLVGTTTGFARCRPSLPVPPYPKPCAAAIPRATVAATTEQHLAPAEHSSGRSARSAGSRGGRAYRAPIHDLAFRDEPDDLHDLFAPMRGGTRSTVQRAPDSLRAGDALIKWPKSSGDDIASIQASSCSSMPKTKNGAPDFFAYALRRIDENNENSSDADSTAEFETSELTELFHKPPGQLWI